LQFHEAAELRLLHLANAGQCETPSSCHKECRTRRYISNPLGGKDWHSIAFNAMIPLQRDRAIYRGLEERAPSETRGIRWIVLASLEALITLPLILLERRGICDAPSCIRSVQLDRIQKLRSKCRIRAIRLPKRRVSYTALSHLNDLEEYLPKPHAFAADGANFEHVFHVGVGVFVFVVLALRSPDCFLLAILGPEFAAFDVILPRG
jgi:hypothetical protein